MERYVDIFREANADAYIYLMTPPCAYEYIGDEQEWQGKIGYGIDPDIIENEICPMIASISADKDVSVIDLKSSQSAKESKETAGRKTCRRFL